ncbi:hypothetical protein MIB92_12215 [Aestuariirhabdus sp. Z084]|uniref:hypothetical protein n=1 Tax=Aestuariirhabdus haliotis TaxID=2918751 RepID=UPI00201B3706|nr:hypothetical protein [Aestuariirhabdus haliotis]MCL6416418.1 hypothetical protein [Aestuariirhabdus haliotis]MCL6420416.1 hypothetical protein [Aestuariirhabdus haliotis]
MKKVLSVVVLAVLSLLLLTQIDDDLSEDSKKLISRLNESARSESYLYLYGIFAQAGENPTEVGRSLLQENRKLDADEHYQVIDYPDSNKLPLPKGDEFCRLREAGCLEYLFSSKVNAQELLREHSVLVSRSNRFLQFDEYTTLSKPTAHERIPPYHYLSAAERIKLLQAISIYQNGSAGLAMESLALQFKKIRQSMALQDNLIGKLIFLIKLSDILDVYSVILSREGETAYPIPGLRESEKSFRMIAAREFGMSYYLFKSLDRDPELFTKEGNLPGWLTRMLYKPNMTINAASYEYYRLERLAQLSPADFAQQVALGNQEQPSTSKVRNYVGGTLLSISSDFDSYVASFADFDAKLALFNQLYHSRLTPANMTNPYYGQETPQETKGRLCFSGPLEDARSLRCLKVKLEAPLPE